MLDASAKVLYDDHGDDGVSHCHQDDDHEDHDDHDLILLSFLLKKCHAEDFFTIMQSFGFFWRLIFMLWVNSTGPAVTLGGFP